MIRVTGRHAGHRTRGCQNGGRSYHRRDVFVGKVVVVMESRSDRSSSAVLSRREMADWCRTAHRKRQISFLRLNGVPFDLDLDGRPVVRRWVFDGRTRRAEVQPPTWRPNKAVG